jgi:Kdo2-lipid IVA lauroyltransferase/acyltransferase
MPSVRRGEEVKRRARWFHGVSAGVLLGVGRAVGSLPLWIAYPIGGALGALAFYVDRRHRRVACTNLRLAFGEALPPAEIAAMTRAHFRCLGETFVDFCRLVRLSPERLRQVVEVEGLDVLGGPKAKSQGVLYVTGHFGPWEYLPAISTHITGEPLTIVARPLDNPFLDRFVNAVRRRWGSRVVEKRAAMRDVMEVLRQGGRVGVLIDQHVSQREGVFVKFFGHPACTTPAPALLALRSGAAVVPVVVHRVAPGRFRVLFGKEIHPPRTGRVKEDVTAMTAAMTTALEELIRRQPEQWLWVHRRWKYITKAKR